MRVLVTDGNERAALAVTRALGREAIEVIVGAETQRSLASASRYCRESVSYPSPYQDPQGFVNALLDVVRKQRVDALFPVSDIAMHVIGPEKTRFAGYTHIPTPDAGCPAHDHVVVVLESLRTQLLDGVQLVEDLLGNSNAR